MWAVTKAINDYNQHGDYFVACFIKKPSFDEFLDLYLKSEGIIKENFDEAELLEKVRYYYYNRGRFRSEDTWYFLSEITQGHLYKKQHSLK